MRTKVPEKILKVVADIKTRGNVPLTRLTVLKKWFEQRPERMPAFALWMARKAAGRKGETTGEHGALLDEARKLLGNSDQIDPAAADDLCRCARDAQSKLRRHKWGSVRVIDCWPLYLVEKGLGLYRNDRALPSDGYQLAVSWAENYDPRFGPGLNGPSAGKLDELVRWMFGVEAREEERGS